MKQIVLAFFLISIVFGVKSNAQQTKPTERLAVNYDELIDRYIDSLNETDGKRRRELIEQVWTKTGVFSYPQTEVKGHNAIDVDVQKVQKQYPKAKVRRVSEIETIENKYVRFKWEFGEPNGDVLINGWDFVVIVDGKLDLVVGFFDYIRNMPK